LDILVVPYPDRAQHRFHLGGIKQHIFKTGNAPGRLAGLPINNSMCPKIVLGCQWQAAPPHYMLTVSQ
jgi:hypothetical protein